MLTPLIALFFSIRLFGSEIPIGSPLSSPFEIKIDVQKFKLNNGLVVLMTRDPSAPLLSYHQWFRVGSRHEQAGRTGLAHFFEHLMFKGTTKYPPGKFDKIIQSNGGANNAFTSRDYTGYYVDLPGDKLELVMDIESDRMRNLVLEQKSIASEREVVKEERRSRVDDDVMGTLWEQIFLTVYKVHPYKEPVLGSMKDLEASTIEDLRSFYNAYYAPNNAVVVVSGNIEYDKTKALIEKYYGSIAAQNLPIEEIPPEPLQTAERTQNIVKDVQSETLAIVYRTPALKHADTPALDLLANVLGNGSSSRLHKRLVYNEQTSSSASSWTYGQRDSSLFALTVSMKPGVSSARALSSVNNETQRIKSELVTDSELAKAKNQLMLSFISQLKTASGKAYALASAEVLYDDYTYMFEELLRYEKITKEDLKRVAGAYLNPQNRSVVKVVPRKTRGASL